VQNDVPPTFYSPLILAVYDVWVLGISNRWIWRCPTSRLLAHYRQHVSSNHLDVGVGTGYYLKRCRFPEQPRIGLLDSSPHALAATAKKIARYHPEIYQRDLLEDFTLDAPPFDSIGFNYVWHCLPGDQNIKAAVFGRLKRQLKPGGTLFGSTLLASEPMTARSARRLMRYYNRRGIFANEGDTEAALRAALEQHFQDVAIQRVGCAALFAAH
jgi:SAM-dependent methyltransferase